MSKKNYVFVGASNRAYHMFMRPMVEEYSDYCNIKGVYDINPGRAQVLAEEFGIPRFDDFAEMIKKTNPDVAIITTVDAFHGEYIIRTLEMGCDVITEKPMVIDAKTCNAVLETEKRTGRKVTVTFNYRYAPFSTAVKKLIAEGTIGDIFSVHFEWMLDRNMEVLAHGTSYFRRWNARMEKSGGLLVHKSTHHFDLINWFLNQKPQAVSAFGKLNLYGAAGSNKYAEGIYGKNCRNCAHVKDCKFYYQLNEDEIKLYADNEKYDGYYKDGCVYASDINIYDTMGANVLYDKGTILTYSLNATCAYEGWRMGINGSEGRIEAYLPETGPDSEGHIGTIRIFDLNNNVKEHKMEIGKDHGGGDKLLRNTLFIGGQPDPLGHRAGTIDGAASIIIGAAANISIKEKRLINISELIKF